MFPWFSMGHITPYLHLSNKLSQRGHRISFFVPKTTQSKLHHLNLFPLLITFIPIPLPQVDGLPYGAETTSDIPLSLSSLLMSAMDLTESHIEALLLELKPNIVFFDMMHWIPNLTRRLDIKSVQYPTFSSVSLAYYLSPLRISKGVNFRMLDLLQPPPGFPDSSIKLHVHEARASLTVRSQELGGIRVDDRIIKGSSLSDAVGFRGVREIDGPFADYIAQYFGKPVLLSGPVIIPKPLSLSFNSSLYDEKLVQWLGKSKAGSVVFCSLGHDIMLQKTQFQELLSGFELLGMPYLAALNPPIGFESVEEALPEGFKERIQGRGLVVNGGCVQKQLILEHPSVGCYIFHCGTGSLLEGLVYQSELVFLPYRSDQVLNARLMAKSLKVGVEVEKGEEDGLFSKESVCKAVRTVMDNENEIGKEVRANRAQLREILLQQDFESSNIDSFCKNLQDLCT